MQLNERQDADIFVIFTEPEDQEANSFVDDRVRECRNKFLRGNFNSCVVNLRIVYPIIVLFVVTSRQTEAFILLERLNENMCDF